MLFSEDIPVNVTHEEGQSGVREDRDLYVTVSMRGQRVVVTEAIRVVIETKVFIKVSPRVYKVYLYLTMAVEADYLIAHGIEGNINVWCL